MDASDLAHLPIGALAKQTGCKVETIRYYENIGVLPPPARSSGGQRRYTINHLKRLNFVRRARALGFTLNEVRDLLRLVDGADYTCAEVEAVTLAHLGDVRTKIADLRKLERVLKDMASQCDGGTVPECPVIDALFGAVE